VLVSFFSKGIDYSRDITLEGMTEISRICKSGSKWTQDDLESFNIKVLKKFEKEFFGVSLNEVSLDGVPYGLVNLELSTTDDMESYKILEYLDLAMLVIESEESAVDDFASRLLEVLKFEKDGQVIRTRKNIRLFMCGKYTHAKTDVCIVDKKRILFLIQENKSHIRFSDPEPQLIAEAIAAFQHNNERIKYLGLEEIREHTFPCITMVGTYPTFYKIKITRELDKAVRSGKFPVSKTLVERFNPIDDESGYSRGMRLLGDRKRILQSFIAFRSVYNDTLLSS
jgi:hypothetical protein